MPVQPALRFLVVDGLDGVQQFACKLLQGYGFKAEQVRCARHPDEALTLASDWLPDFVITDAFAGKPLDGLALFETLRRLQPQCKLGLTAFEITPALQARAKALNARFVLKKPFSAETLRQTLQSSLEWMARERPELAARLTQESAGRLDARAGRRINLPSVTLPPALKPGDPVQYEGRRRKVQAVVIRHGEQLAQLEGLGALVPVDQLSR